MKGNESYKIGHLSKDKDKGVIKKQYYLTIWVQIVCDRAKANLSKRKSSIAWVQCIYIYIYIYMHIKC